MKRIAIFPVMLLAIVACGNQASTAENIAQEPQHPVATEEVEALGDAAKAHHIVISKETMHLTLYDSDNLVVCRFPIAVGKHYGNKQRRGDMKTPEGVFSIEQIQNSTQWVHDFGDGKGLIEGCYGNWFIRLKTPPHKGIGIHGTHAPESIGTRATEGCIRLENSDLDSLKPLVHIGMMVRIESSAEDRRADGIEESDAEMVMTSSEPRRIESSSSEQQEQRTTAAAVEENTPATPPATAPAEDESVVWYTIQDGDLVGRIAQRYGTTVKEIQRLNPDLNVDRISIGQRIRVPGAAPVAESTPTPTSAATDGGEEVWYTIQDGDLVGRIAQRYGTTSKRIAELNPGINIDRISIGQRIRVK